MKKLNEMTVKELQSTAKENGIALSYTENGKRHRLNKPELIAVIEAKQNEQKATTTITVDVVEVKEVKQKPTVYTNVKLVKKLDTQAKEIDSLKPHQITQFVLKTVKSLNCKQELHKFKVTLLSYITDNMNKSKRSIKSQWALQLNKVSFILKQAESKTV